MIELARGAVVLRRRSIGIVWALDDIRVTLLPIVELAPDEPRRAGDVPVVRPEDLAVIGIGGAGIVVRVSDQQRPPRSDQRVQGLISGALACELSKAMVRLHVENRHRDRWSSEREKRAERLAHEKPLRP